MIITTVGFNLFFRAVMISSDRILGQSTPTRKNNLPKSPLFIIMKIKNWTLATKMIEKKKKRENMMIKHLFYNKIIEKLRKYDWSNTYFIIIVKRLNNKQIEGWSS